MKPIYAKYLIIFNSIGFMQRDQNVLLMLKKSSTLDVLPVKMVSSQTLNLLMQ